ncbi:hypothetical protein BABINDRAFT_170945 [Babjeviella inositovora NRRL Y-12698]|uniref:Manganese/iron superoxide dismutase C-terminal domain-containing protein n=1 Tax=Babjeviella inositovora NRRL Y-12698 TaxID=984486 RepID=A0A1E3QS76_9ASCO|nr:uncharacterized protein BABINDRAFT_170945 [Babjeviella inositovora NRRL Y-12698]ODQ80520.1 hypothetical protein BABINDRAFT_170945 [Babjeviella inositovora NRRL Y-12698]
MLRSVHVVPTLKNQQALMDNGLTGLYSPTGFKVAWTDYQQFLTLNLTMATVGTEYELKKPFDIVVMSSMKAHESTAFHYASQAHNNHLFFEQLCDSASNRSAPSRTLLAKLESSFGSLDAFRNEFLLAADTLMGQGWVFLVEDKSKRVRIMTCNNDGTPYADGRHHEHDLNGPIDEAAYEFVTNTKQGLQAGDRQFNLPLVCVNVWDHAYIQDFGVNGKADYLEAFWKALNWDVVNARLYSFEK